MARWGVVVVGVAAAAVLLLLLLLAPWLPPTFPVPAMGGPSDCASLIATTTTTPANAPWGAVSAPAQVRAFEEALAVQLSQPFRGFTFRVPSPDKPLRRAYVVLLAEDDPYHLCGMRALMASLRRTGTTADVVAMAVKGTSEATLAYVRALGYRVREVPRLQPDRARDGYYAVVFSALALWTLTEYDCVVKLDADMVLLANVDELFLYNHFAATPDYPAGLPQDNPRCLETAICQHTSHDFRAQYLNGAVLVVQPNAEVHARMVAVLDKHEEQLVGGPSEQGFLNWFFKDKWMSLPHYYNVRQPALRAFPMLFAVSPPRAFHFIGGGKPWQGQYECNRYCQQSPLELWHAQLWYVFYNDPTVAAIAPPPAMPACQDHLRLTE
jgi:hypothetical protein